MERSLVVAGFGGQGIMVIGNLLGYTASETTDKFVTFFPSYGAEQRGGTANCYVVISDEMIGAPMVDQMDDLIVMNTPSLVKFIDRLKPGGNLFVNSSIVKMDHPRADVNIIEVPINSLAAELGEGRVGNMVMLGVYIGYTDVLPEDKVKETIVRKLGKKTALIPVNEAAYARGLEIGKAAVAAN